MFYIFFLDRLECIYQTALHNKPTVSIVIDSARDNTTPNNNIPTATHP